MTQPAGVAFRSAVRRVSESDSLAPDALEPLRSITETAVTLGMTRKEALHLIDAGTLRAIRVGNSWVVPKSALRG